MTTDVIALPRRGRPPKVTFQKNAAVVTVQQQTISIPLTAKGNIAPRFQPDGPREEYAFALVQRELAA